MTKVQADKSRWRKYFDSKQILKKGFFNYGEDVVMAFSTPVVGCLVKKG